MVSEKDTVQRAIAAFAKLHGGGQVVRGIDRGELNLNEMTCVQQKQGVWVCTLPHIHYPLNTLVYEFVYKDQDGHKPHYTCQCITPPIEQP